MRLHVREATSVDADAVTDLVRRAYRGPESRQGWTTEADLLDDLRIDVAGVRAKIDEPDGCVLLLGEGTGTLLGCCELRRQPGGVAYFGLFAVVPARQGAGLGRRLLTAAEAHARHRWGATALEMTVIAQRSELIAWYQRCGYRLTGERRPFPYDDLVGGEALRDDLEFVVLRKGLASGEELRPVRVGAVARLRVFPVRSAGALEPDRVVLDAAGLVGDRRVVVVDEQGHVVTGKDLASLAQARPLLDDQGSVVALDPPLATLAGDIGRRLTLAPAPEGSWAGGAAVHVISVGADLAPDAPVGCDPGRRANIVLDLDLALAVPGAERSWTGALLDVGAAQLRLTRLPRRCLGVYAEVTRGGPVAVGDDVVLRDASSGGRHPRPVGAAG